MDRVHPHPRIKYGQALALSIEGEGTLHIRPKLCKGLHWESQEPRPLRRATPTPACDAAALLHLL